MAHIGESPQLYFNRFYTGWMTQRNPLAVPIRVFGRRIIELYDAIWDGQNMELNNFLKLQRAPGFIQYNSNTFSGIPQNFYSFKQTGTTTPFPIVDTTTNVYYAPPGSTAPTSLVSKTPPTQTTFKGIGPYLYMGNSAFSQKWDGTTVTNWGIAIGATSGSSQANAGAGADVSKPGTAWTNPGNVVGAIGHGAPDYATVTLGAGGGNGSPTDSPSAASDAGGAAAVWSNPTNVFALDGVFASAAMNGGSGILTTNNLNVTGYGFAIPAGATITGIIATASVKGSNSIDVSDLGVQLLKAGTLVGTNHANGNIWTTSVSAQTYGSSSDLWGATWTPSDINNANFGIAYSAQNAASATRTAFIDYISIQVFYSLPAGGSNSDYLEATTYGFAITGTNTINGIQVAVRAFGPVSGATLFVAMISGGNIVGNWKSIALNTNGVAQTNTFGGSADLWGTSWTPTVVNASNFGVAMYVTISGGSGNFGINAAQVTVYSTGAPVATPTGAGTMAAITGYVYVYCYGNSLTGHVSSPTTYTASTGAFNSKASVNVTVTASTDTQVNQIRVFRTTDGGPLSQLFELPNSPFANTTTSIVDTATDTQLQLTQAPQPLVNNPPPAGLTAMEWYAGRLWGLVGNLLYFSTGPDATIGNPQECWAPGYVFPLPTPGIRLKAIPSGMLVFTVDGVHIVQGTSTPSFTVNEFYPDIGIRQYNAFDTDGTNIYIFTSDRQLLQLNANGVTEVGANIGDKLDGLDANQVYISAHRSGSQDQNLFISDGSSTIYSYNLRQQAWNPPRRPVGGCNAIGSIEILSGVYKFLLGATTATQVVLQRDLATFTDNGNAYSTFVTFGNFQLADPGALAQMQAIALEYSIAGAQPIVAILPNEISGTFTTLTQPVAEPPELQLSTSYSSFRWYLKTAAVTENMKHFQLKITFAAAATKDELAGVGMWGNLATSGVTATRPLPQIQGR